VNIHTIPELRTGLLIFKPFRLVFRKEEVLKYNRTDAETGVAGRIAPMGACCGFMSTLLQSGSPDGAYHFINTISFRLPRAAKSIMIFNSFRVGP